MDPPTSSSSATAPSTKRNRSTLSCVHCRQAKAKCDRQSPCGLCLRKGRAEQCTYPLPVSRKKAAVSLQKRLRNLESMVKDVMASNDMVSGDPISQNASYGDDLTALNTGSLKTTAYTSTSQIPEGVNDLIPTSKVVLNGNESKYIGNTHWKSLLENIEEARTLFDDVEGEFEDEMPQQIPNDLSFSTLAIDVTASTSRLDLVTGLPARHVVDRLVSRFFNTYTPAQYTIHVPSFQNEYHEFWTHPELYTVEWLAFLYSILVTSSLSIMAMGEPHPDTRTSSRDVIHFYRRSSQQGLILSGLTRPGNYTIQTLILNIEAEFIWNKGDPVQFYLMAGTTMRIALQAGLHRDATKVQSNLTPFQAEMRRRTWTHLLQVELLASLQAALPPLGPTIDSDTSPATNLLDSDFGPDTAVLPPPRPISEVTPCSYGTFKRGVFLVTSKVVLLHHRLEVPKYQVIKDLDAQLISAYNQIPAHFLLQLRLLVTDNPDMMIKRLSLALMFHRSRFMLHRKYLNLPHTTEGFEESKQASIEIAVEILRLQALLHEAFMPGGPLVRDRWLLSALSMQEFLSAGMIIYQTVDQHEATDTSPVPFVSRSELVKLLKTSHTVWTQTDNMSAEMQKAAKLIGLLLVKIGQSDSIRSVSSQSFLSIFDGPPSVFTPEQPIEGSVVPTCDSIQNLAMFAQPESDNWNFGALQLGRDSDTADWDIFAPGNLQFEAVDGWENMVNPAAPHLQ